MPYPIRLKMIELVMDKCMLCGACAPVCPENIIIAYTTYIDINYDDCTVCEECIKICPFGALKLLK